MFPALAWAFFSYFQHLSMAFLISEFIHGSDLALIITIFFSLYSLWSSRMSVNVDSQVCIINYIFNCASNVPCGSSHFILVRNKVECFVILKCRNDFRIFFYETSTFQMMVRHTRIWCSRLDASQFKLELVILVILMGDLMTFKKSKVASILWSFLSPLTWSESWLESESMYRILSFNPHGI